MTQNCVTVPNYTSGAQLSGLTPNATYYVEIIAVAATQGYVSSNTAVPSQTSSVATSQLGTPTNVTLGYGASPGSLTVSFTPPTPNPGISTQTYTVEACTSAAMTNPGCVTNTNFSPSGATLTGLNPGSPGNPGVNYYVEVTANASSGYLASPASTPVSGVDESQIGAPGTPSVSQGAAHGSIVVTFTASPGTPPSGYTAVACTNYTKGVLSGCTGPQTITSGGQITNLTSRQTYYVQITANGLAGYASNISGVSAQVQTR